MRTTRGPSSLGFWRGVARLVRFDLRRFRVPMAIVVGLELLRAALAEGVLHLGPQLHGAAFSGTSAAFELQVLDGTLWLATVLTTALLVQADHPTDDRAFLRTRPIGPSTLVTAKLLMLFALVSALPFLATAARLVAYGAPSASIAASAVQFLVIGGAVMLPACALALAARTLARFLAAAAALAVLWNVATAAIAALGPRGPFAEDLVNRVVNQRILHTFALPLTDWQWVDGRGWPVALGITVIAAGLLGAYYRTRRVVTTVGAAAALVAAPAIVPMPASTSPPAADLARAAEDLRLPALVVPSVATLTMRAGPGDHRWLAFGNVLLPPLPANVSTERKLGRVQLTGPGLDVSTDGLELFDHDGARASDAAAHATEPAFTSEPDSVMLFYLSRQEVELLRGRRVRVSAPVDLRFTRHVHVADLPIRAGAAFRTDAYLVEILDLAVEPRVSHVRCRFTRFPTLARSHPNVMAFIAHPNGHVVRAMPGLRPGFDASSPAEDRVGWAHGRNWTRQAVLPILGLAADSTELRLRIVESRPAGSVRAALDAHDVPVREREPRPVTTPTRF